MQPLHRRYHEVHQTSPESVPVPTDQELTHCSCFLNAGLREEPKPTGCNGYTAPQLLSKLEHPPLRFDHRPVLTGITFSTIPWNLNTTRRCCLGFDFPFGASLPFLWAASLQKQGEGFPVQPFNSGGRVKKKWK